MFTVSRKFSTATSLILTIELLQLLFLFVYFLCIFYALQLIILKAVYLYYELFSRGNWLH